MHTTLISPELLEAHLSDSSWLIADCRYNLKDEEWGRTQYLAGHIPGAVFVGLAHDLATRRTGANGRHPLPAPETIAATFSRLGISGSGTSSFDTGLVMIWLSIHAPQFVVRRQWCMLGE